MTETIRAMRFTDSQRRKLWFAVVASLLAHTLLLALALSGTGLGAPGLGLNWQERRVEATDVRVVMVPPRMPAGAPPGSASPGVEGPSPAQPAPCSAASPRGRGNGGTRPDAHAGRGTRSPRSGRDTANTLAYR